MERTTLISGSVSFGETEIPNEILDTLKDNLYNYNGTDFSILEIHPKSDVYLQMVNEIKDSLSKLLNVPHNYKIILMDAESKAMDAAVPLNLIGRSGQADYVITGRSSQNAAKEAEKYGIVHYSTPIETTAYIQVPHVEKWDLKLSSSYIHIVTSERCNGLEFKEIPKIPGLIPLVGNISHNIITKPMDLQKFGMVYSCSDKIFGIPGLTVVIIREDLLGHALSVTPSALDFKYNLQTEAQGRISIATIFLMDAYLKWLMAKGSNIQELSQLISKKSEIIFKVIDNSGGFYYSPVPEDARSDVYITFRIGGMYGNIQTEEKFLFMANHRGFQYLKGCSGGIRVVITHALKDEDVNALAKFMEDFNKMHH